MLKCSMTVEKVNLDWPGFSILICIINFWTFLNDEEKKSNICPSYKTHECRYTSVNIISLEIPESLAEEIAVFVSLLFYLVQLQII